ncbi:MAG: peptide chain release factor N(5)-glutamine methyltransferase [Candidatus Staskawiczbacteria bacterium]|nr:peptide chain release factor N(5)-glutamine methyltransferase [Candidatus Staskawiczbacteria bacterium]
MKDKNFQNKIGWILQEKYSGKMTSEAKEDIERFKKGEPLDYIIGFTNFLGCKIDLSKRTLIPRVETEFWVEKIIDEINSTQLEENLQILDVFSGSGCVGIAIMRHIKNTDVVFADSEKNCLEQISINCKLNKVNKKRFSILNSDVFSNIKGKFDYIFANPPYIPTKSKNKIQKSVLKYEPSKALFGGNDGLQYVSKFLVDAKKFLKPQGKIFMEFDSTQKIKIEELLKKFNYKSWKFKKDQYGKWRLVVIE